MATQSDTKIDVPAGLTDAIRSFPVERIVEHCGQSIAVDPLAFYAHCAECGAEIKLRGFSAHDEIEDVFDAVLAWMNEPAARRAAQRRQEALAEDE
jgi:hypothetical protein